MTPFRTINLLRALFVIFAAVLGSMIGEVMIDSQWKGGVLGVIGGLLVVLADRLLKGVSLRIFSSATFGLLLGVLFALLLLKSDILHYLTEEARWLISLAVYAIFGYLGMMLAMRSNRDEFALIIPYVRFQQSAVFDTPIVVDTNVVIDGRIEEVRAAGFISGSLIIPRFILDEMQLLADSSDPLRRERGRRGLENLNRMQASTEMIVSIHEAPAEPQTPVDTQLVNLARVLGSRLLTNDANLAKIARLQHVPVLNLFELSKALSSGITAGDAIELALVKEGREAHQAVGYQPDGSMVVVNNARNYLGRTVWVTVSSSIPTTAGRIFFAELKQA
jgi:uncharacterized protein YacL